MKLYYTIASRSVDELGRTVICRPICMEYGFETGDYFAFRRIENGILVTKVADQSEEETGSRLRRMDDLGRIVIPRTMRNELNIREGDELAQMNHENGVLLVLNRIDCGL